MSDARDLRLLEALSEFLSLNGCKGEVTDAAGTPVLLMGYDGGEAMPEFFTVSVEHLTDDTAQVCIINTLFSGLGKERIKELISLTPYLNGCLAYGFFGIDRDAGSLYFSSALDVTGLSSESLATCFTASFDLSRRTCAEAMRLLLPLINGERSFSDLDPQELSIIQF